MTVLRKLYSFHYNSFIMFLPWLGVICYDDACHLKKFAQNPVRSTQTALAARITGMQILCDRFHFKNHIDGWCRQHCNPLTSANLQVNVVYVKEILSRENVTLHAQTFCQYMLLIVLVLTVDPVNYNYI